MIINVNGQLQLWDEGTRPLLMLDDVTMTQSRCCLLMKTFDEKYKMHDLYWYINGFITVRNVLIIHSMQNIILLNNKQAKKSYCSVVSCSGVFQNQNEATEHENTAAGSCFASSFV